MSESVEWVVAEGKTLRLVVGDLTELEADALVNAANEHLKHGGGVAGALLKKGGFTIQEESDAWVREHGPVPTGSAAVTGAGRLKARYLIHAVGPVWGSGDEDPKLASATLAALEAAERLNLTSIAFPAISTGIFGFPRDRCARIMIGQIADFMKQSRSVTNVTICLRDDAAFQAFREALRNLDDRR